jgi:hypothetical protein
MLPLRLKAPAVIELDSVYFFSKSLIQTRIVEMKAFQVRGIVWAPVLALVMISGVIGCGGSNSAGGGIDGSGFVSQGAVSAHGSIVVNGTEFDTSNAAIIIKGVEIGVGDAVIRTTSISVG